MRAAHLGGGGQQVGYASWLSQKASEDEGSDGGGLRELIISSLPLGLEGRSAVASWGLQR